MRRRVIVIASIALFAAGVGGAVVVRSTIPEGASTMVPPTPTPTFAGSTTMASSVTTVAASTSAASVTVTVTNPSSSTAPATTAVAAAIDPECPATAHGAVVDRDRQRARLCDQGVGMAEFPITSAWSMPDPGTYPVYAKDLQASSTFGGHLSTMTHFVAFSYGKNTGARVAFHSLPQLTNGAWAQPPESVGALERRGESSGCIRVLPADAALIWDWLAIGDEVHVVT